MSANPSPELTAGQPDRTPDAVLRHLLEGNHRFITDTCLHAGRDRSRRAVLTAGQAPVVTVFSCSDSRVAPEVLFDQGLGDVFTVRTAGHVFDSAVLGTLEYGVEVLDTPLLLILGHESCGALAAARGRIGGEDLPGGHINALVHGILRPFVPSQAPTDELAMTRAHVGNTATELLERSPILRDAVAAGRTSIVGMRYGLATGEVAYVGHAGTLAQIDYPLAVA